MLQPAPLPADISLSLPIQVLESGGSDLAVAITAASVALADAGVELFDLVPACQVVSQESNSNMPPTPGCLYQYLPFEISNITCEIIWV